ncbi:MAG: MarR family transcriptional regulator [Caulobacteraceae bacterium]|nr:MarR family transcriptional regulator [Caulobacteraceae bacterium]
MSPDTDMLALADELRPGLLRVSRQLRRDAQVAGLSALDTLLLGMIKKRPGVGVSELAELESLSRPTMSEHAKRLERAGWVARLAPGEGQDRRRIGLKITPAGTRALDAVRRQRNDWLAARLARLSPEARAALAAAARPLLELAGAPQ